MRHRAKKSLGQHFLVDGELQRRIVGALDPKPDDEILEVGPGQGALTQHLAGSCRSLVLVELDRDLAAGLEERFGGIPGVRVVQGSILDLGLEALTRSVAELKVVGNIPYNITSPILFHLLDRPRPGVIVLMVQREVGERILAEPGTSAFGALTVGVRTVADPERILRVPPSAFRPAPAVESMVLRLRPHRPPRLTPPVEEALRSLTRAAFQQRRKQFQAILRKSPGFRLSHDQVGALERSTGFDLRRRPETFSPEDFVRLSAAARSLS